MTQIKDLFDLIPGNGLELYKMKQMNNGIPFVGRTSKNNGITGFVEVVKDVNLMPENTISVSCGGSVLESFFQLHSSLGYSSHLAFDTYICYVQSD